MKPLIIFEMANNHQGSHDLGLQIILEHTKVKNKFPQFDYAFKMQYRDLPTFIHPDYFNRDDIPYVKRFKECTLSEKDFLSLKHHASINGFKTACTPFDEASVRKVVEHKYDILKVGSPSITDWDLWDEILLHWSGPIIASLGGADEYQISHIVDLCGMRDLTLMHCVSEYPCDYPALNINQIDLLQAYPACKVGFSTHERPGSFGVLLALCKGAQVFEWHVGLEDGNKYSLTPPESLQRIEWMAHALSALGPTDKRVEGVKPTQFQRTRTEDGRMWWIPSSSK